MTKLFATFLSFFVSISIARAHGANHACQGIFVDMSVATAPVFDVSKRMGGRGLLSVFPKQTDALRDHYSKSQISWWGIEVYIMPNIEAARAHDADVTTGAVQGLYIIDATPGLTGKDGLVSVANKARGPEIFRSILDRKPEVVYFKFSDTAEKGTPREMVVVPADEVAARLSSDDTILRTRATSMGPHFWRPGWSYPEDVYGVFEFADLWQSKSFKKLMERARKVQREGYTFDFSRTREEFLDDLKVAAKTERADQETVGQAYYDVQENIDIAVAKFDKGEAFTIRGLKNGVSEGGILVMKHGNILEFETTFYTGDATILIPQIAGMYFFRRMEKAGVPKLFIDMVSNYSYSLKGKRTSMLAGKTFNEELVARGPVAFDFTSPLKIEELKP